VGTVDLQLIEGKREGKTCPFGGEKEKGTYESMDGYVVSGEGNEILTDGGTPGEKKRSCNLLKGEKQSLEKERGKRILGGKSSCPREEDRGLGSPKEQEQKMEREIYIGRRGRGLSSP